MWRQVPNLITTSRLLLAVVFFACLSWYQYEGRGHSALLTWAFVVGLIAISTDFLDGWLARKWKVESRFGRVVDPFVDKILVLGSFIFFGGKNFIIPDEIVNGHVNVAHTITGITPAMTVIILGRELLVTSLRGLMESSGVSFGADLAGKIKMVLQSVTILVIVAYVYFLGVVSEQHPAWRAGYVTWATIFRNGMIWLTLLVTVWSAWGYLRRSVSLLRATT
ncbi:MAG TPA: CDP-alcohol phosphatidyltransferase family protein [Tepidisphaeraceae bacterium]